MVPVSLPDIVVRAGYEIYANRISFSKSLIGAAYAASGLQCLMSPRDILVLYIEGVYDGSDKQERGLLEAIMREYYRQPAKDICKALLDHAIKQD